jgi:RNA ligase (TIGR02306 family)
MGEGFRIKTMKLRGQISQGLLLPVDHFQELPKDIPFGEDVSDILGVKKWEIPEVNTSMGQALAPRPSFLPKSDEPRIQAEPTLIDALHGKPYYITTKMDGTSVTVYWDENGNIGACSRNIEIKDDKDSMIWEMIRRYGLDKKNYKSLMIQGELCGEGIQKNRLAIKGDRQWFPFDMYYIDTAKYATFPELELWCKENNIKPVPLEEQRDAFAYTFYEILLRAEGLYPSGQQKEGIVVRSWSLEGGMKDISFKVINNKFLLKDKD